MSSTPVLELEGVKKRFGEVSVLEGVSLRLYAGEVHVLAGENGAGKSTLIKILAGILAPNEGEILYQGGKDFFPDPMSAKRAGISVVHQELSLIEGLSVLDNLYLGREKERSKEDAIKVLGKLGIDRPLSVEVSALTLSEKSRLEIAKALLFPSRILILDEPTSALNSEEVRHLFALIRELKARGTSIVYISHRMNEIRELADRVTVLRDGKTAGSALYQDITEGIFLHWMIGREMKSHFPKPPARDFGNEEAALKITLQECEGIETPLSFQVRAGEILGFFGLQGSGVEVLLPFLFGASPSKSIQEGMALLPAERKKEGLSLIHSIRWNTTLAALPRFSKKLGFISAQQEKKETQEVAKKLKLKFHDLEQEVKSLSGGNQQKVAIAKWILCNPSVLLLNEPTRGVDVGAKEEIYQWIFSEAAKGRKILLVTTEMPELIALSDRILAFSRGKLIEEFTREAVREESLIKAALGESA